MYSQTQKIWRQTDAVCFDFDSTVTQEEGIDELAKFCNKGDEIAKMTNQAMSGAVPFRKSLETRLDIIKPTLGQVKDFIRTCTPKLSPGIKSLIEFLHKYNVPVYIISGGFRSIINPVANQLNVPLENVFANRLKFYYNGDYAGFDENEPTSCSGGKNKVIQLLKEKFGYSNLVMIGDGATDLEACPPADAFIGYGGNVIREKVKTNSKWYITDFQELVDVLLMT